MTGPSNPTNTASANPTQAPSTNIAGTVQLTPAEAKTYVNDHYRRQEMAVLLNLLQNFLGFRIEGQRDLSRVLDFLEAFKKWQRQLRTMKNKDRRNLGLSKRRTQAEQRCDTDPPSVKRWRWPPGGLGSEK